MFIYDHITIVLMLHAWHRMLLSFFFMKQYFFLNSNPGNVKIILVLGFNQKKLTTLVAIKYFIGNEIFSFWWKVLENIIACLILNFIPCCCCVVLYWLYAIEISILLGQYNKILFGMSSVVWCKFSDYII